MFIGSGCDVAATITLHSTLNWDSEGVHACGLYNPLYLRGSLESRVSNQIRAMTYNTLTSLHIPNALSNCHLRPNVLATQHGMPAKA